MEFRGLEAYIEMTCPEVLLDVNLRESADLYRTENQGKEPVLLIHGNSCSNWLYGANESPGGSLGLYEEFKERWNKLIDVLQQNFIRAVFFFDSCPTWDREIYLWAKRSYLKGKNVNKELKKVGRDNWIPLEVETKFLKSDIETTEFLKYMLRARGCEIIQGVHTFVYEIRDFIAKHGCFGLLAQGTNFIAFDIDVTLFSVKHLNIETLDTKIYSSQSLATHLDVDKSHLPLLATLCGNDFLDRSDLYMFYVSLFREYNANLDFDYWRIPPLTAMPPIAKVAEWIRENRERLDPSKLADQIAALPGLQLSSHRIETSLRCYSMPAKAYERTAKGAWLQIVRMAKQRYRSEGLHHSFFSVIACLRNFHVIYYRDYLCRMTPSVAKFLKPLRKKMYGILLKDCPHEPCAVEEWMKKVEPSKAHTEQVEFECPDVHPGLLRLWGDSTEEEKMKMLCWAVSKSLQLDDLLKIPEELRIGFLSLFYMAEKFKANKPSVRPDLEALVVVIIRLSQYPLLYQRLKSAPCKELPSQKEIYMGHLYTQTWFLMLAVHDACGSPFLNENKRVNNVFFDGKLFQLAYKKRVLKGVDGDILSLNVNLYERLVSLLWPNNAKTAGRPIPGANDGNKAGGPNP